MRGKTLSILTMALLAFVQPAVTLAQPVAASDIAGPLWSRVQAILATAPKGARFGLLVTKADGSPLVEIDPDKRFIPASNTKLFTTALALARLPQEVPGNGVRLEARRGGAPDVILIGRGDARMSSAPDCKIDCLATLADAIAAKIRRVNQVIGDATLFPDQRWSPGMSWNNIGTDSGTAISALSLDDNELPLEVTPTKPGEQAKIALSPYFVVGNEIDTTASGKRDLQYDFAVNGRKLRVYGEIPLGEPYRDRLGIDDPAHYAAWTLQRMLEARGVKVQGQALSRYRPISRIDDPAWRKAQTGELLFQIPGYMAPDLATLAPPPLSEDIAIINKVSQNLHADMLLRRVAGLAGTSSLADGALAIQAMMTSAGIPREGYDFSDGSGMSTYNRVSPRATVGLLRWGAAQPWGASWRASFPIAGVDGTLRRRFVGTPLQGNLWAKTGTLNATNALGGYFKAASGQELTFAFYANDVPDGQSAIPAMEAVLLLIAAQN